MDGIESSSIKGVFKWLISRIHYEGINCRYLGELRNCCSSPKWKTIILHEIVSRAIRHLWRELQRSEMKRLRTLAEEPFKEGEENKIFHIQNLFLSI